MTTSLTRSATFSITDARYVASKLGADLRNLNARYGYPVLSRIPDYVEETAQYLKAGYLNTVDFGFKDGARWVLRLRYRAVSGQLADAVPGALPSALEVAGYPFHSFLDQNSAYLAASQAERDAFEATLPFQRTAGVEPTALSGSYGHQAQYSRNGGGLNRDIYIAR
jgi:hypothetical protein